MTVKKSHDIPTKIAIKKQHNTYFSRSCQFHWNASKCCRNDRIVKYPKITPLKGISVSCPKQT